MGQISSAISGIKFARFFPVDALKKLYNTLIKSQFRYFCTVWGDCRKILKNELQRIE